MTKYEKILIKESIKHLTNVIRDYERGVSRAVEIRLNASYCSGSLDEDSINRIYHALAPIIIEQARAEILLLKNKLAETSK